jgi:hypothetical protein
VLNAGNWLTGWLQPEGETPTTDNTNIIFLLDPRYSQLGPYFVKGAGVYKCVADQSLAREAGLRLPRAKRRFTPGHLHSDDLRDRSQPIGPITPARIAAIQGYHRKDISKRIKTEL